MPSKLAVIAIDAIRPRVVADFWCAVLGWHIVEEDSGIISIAPQDGTWPSIDVIAVPEGKTVKNRLHLDVRVAPGLEGDERMSALESEANRLQGLGATRAYRVEPDKATMESGFITMHDPEGNEFCLD